MKKDLNKTITQINDAKTTVMHLAVTAEINGNKALEISSNHLYNLLEDAYLHAIKMKRLADEA